MTPYQFASDNPIALIDVDGLEGKKPAGPNDLPVVQGTTEPTKPTQAQIDAYVSCLHVPGVDVDFLKLQEKYGEGVSLRLYDVDGAPMTVKGHGGNATIGVGKLIHYGALRSTQYDPDAIAKEAPYLEGMDIQTAFTDFDNVIAQSLRHVEDQLADNGISDVDHNIKEVLEDFNYNAGPNSTITTIQTYKNDIDRVGRVNADWIFYRKVKNGKSWSTTNREREKFRVRYLLQGVGADYKKEIQKIKPRPETDDPREVAPKSKTPSNNDSSI